MHSRRLNHLSGIAPQPYLNLSQTSPAERGTRHADGLPVQQAMSVRLDQS
ncbi:MAG: hypothetical protein AB2565_18755 [Candidatus Thiodiazotropha endolucinida]|uniref:Uncharacterized protein n=1 Tax=Candidatus Thiodiazotropha endolucinida TaxID=1655433 RepID=A0A7Z0VHY7_9GAMM|nr:hypothetical protein [Candidatus Thiodiazotropha endolucinida]MBV2124694.1 hypothetical protein [Candidatus Thiodiazotropha taylori]ODJ85898.1 hypothetical protein CODIS_38720 [Candidatus Thiodiazotropha endolucinida]